MAKKIVKAIVLVEIDEAEEKEEHLVCKLENGTSIILNRGQIFIPIPPETWVDTKDQMYNLPVSC